MDGAINPPIKFFERNFRLIGYEPQSLKQKQTFFVAIVVNVVIVRLLSLSWLIGVVVRTKFCVSFITFSAGLIAAGTLAPFMIGSTALTIGSLNFKQLSL